MLVVLQHLVLIFGFDIDSTQIDDLGMEVMECLQKNIATGELLACGDVDVPILQLLVVPL